MRYKIILILLVGIVTTVSAQTNIEEDTIIVENKGFIKPAINYIENTVFQYLQKSNQTSSDKSFNYSAIGGPYYTNETKVGMGLIGSGLFRLNGCEKDNDPSNISLYINAASSGAYALGIRSSIYFPKKRYWIDSDISFSDTPSQLLDLGIVLELKTKLISELITG